jgi:hypothetical protein
MKKLLKKIVVFTAGLLATIGFTVSNLPANTTQISHAKSFQNITKSTPLYLEHANKLFLDENELSWHYSHSSHSSHVSHQSHYSHYSSRY